MNTLSEDRIIRKREVLEKSGHSNATLYRRIAAGTFPKPLSTGPRSVGWKLSEVQKWMDSLNTVA